MPALALNRLPVWAVLTLQVLEFLQKLKEPATQDSCGDGPASLDIALANTRYSECANNLRDFVSHVDPSLVQIAWQYLAVGLAGCLVFFLAGIRVGLRLGSNGGGRGEVVEAYQAGVVRPEAARPRPGLVQW